MRTLQSLCAACIWRAAGRVWPLAALARKLKTILTVVALAPTIRTPTAGAETRIEAYEAFQRDADTVKLRHLSYYADLIEKCKHVSGRYPLEGMARVPLYVHIANDQQLSGIRGAPPYRHEVRSATEFFAWIGQRCRHKAPPAEYYDPQYAPDYKPNFYIYAVEGRRFLFAVHLHQPFEFARKITDHYYKVEISNVARRSEGIWTPRELLSNAAFRRESRREVAKPGFWDERERTYLHFTHGRSGRSMAGRYADRSPRSTMNAKRASGSSLTARATLADSTALERLFAYIRAGDIQTVGRMLKDAPALARARSGEWAALHVAASVGATGAIALLLKAGALWNDRVEGKTPLGLAIICGKADAARVLIVAGAPTRDVQGTGQSALHVAAQKGMNAIVGLLLDRGMDIDAKTESRAAVTALQDAAFEGQASTVELLIRRGASLNLVSPAGYTPLDDAQMKGHFDVVRLLRAHGGKSAREL